MRLGDVVDELEHGHGLADARAAEQSDLAALGERDQQIDDLHPGLQQVLTARLFCIGRCRTVNWPTLLTLDGSGLIDRLTEDVHDPSQGTGPYRHRDWCAGGLDAHTALESFGRSHRNRAHDAVTELLLHLECQHDVVELQRFVDLGDLVAGKFHVDDRADDLYDLATAHLLFLVLKPPLRRLRSPTAPW